jgi:hypothetical protein
MLQIMPSMKILVAVESADFRRGIDGLARLCHPPPDKSPSPARPLYSAVAVGRR